MRLVNAGANTVAEDHRGKKTVANMVARRGGGGYGGKGGSYGGKNPVANAGADPAANKVTGMVEKKKR